MLDDKISRYLEHDDEVHTHKEASASNALVTRKGVVVRIRHPYIYLRDHNAPLRLTQLPHVLSLASPASQPGISATAGAQLQVETSRASPSSTSMARLPSSS